MGKVPEHIMEQAREVAVSIGSDSLREDTLTIAEALLAAEKRGREEAAKMAELYAAGLERRLTGAMEERITKFFRDKMAHKIEAGTYIAAAIRSGQ